MATLLCSITLLHFNQKKFTLQDTEHYKYYNSSFVPFGPSWVDLEKWNISNPGIVKTHEMLSKSYRRAATIPLNFTFPFYGHDVQNITIGKKKLQSIICLTGATDFTQNKRLFNGFVLDKKKFQPNALKCAIFCI